MTMPDPAPFSGWRLRYWTSEPSPGWPLRVAHALRSALPGARVLVEADPEADVLAISPPGFADPGKVAAVQSLACDAFERAYRAGLN